MADQNSKSNFNKNDKNMSGSRTSQQSGNQKMLPIKTNVIGRHPKEMV